MDAVRRLAVALAFVGAVVVGISSPAWAHITIEPPEAATGANATVSFRVPNERPTAATVKVRVQFPQDHPIASVSLKPVPGWTATVTKSPAATQSGTEGNQLTEQINTITWEGGRIEPDQFQDFEVDLGPLPDGVDRLYFPAIQTYDNGEEVTWIEKPAASGTEPQYPAPSLALVPGVAGAAGTQARDSHGAPVTGSSRPPASGSNNVAAAAPVAANDSTAATTIAGLSLGVALIALVLGVSTTGLLLRQRRAQESPPAASG